MRVLLLGGTGFVGQAVRDALRSEGDSVTSVSRSSEADVILDATDPTALEQVLHHDHDVVVNLLGAGLSAGSVDPETMWAVNAVFPASLYDAMHRIGSPLLVHAASSTERLPGQVEDESDYSRTKHEGSRRLREAAADGSPTLRMLTIHNTYGPRQPAARFVAAAIERLRSGEGIELAYPERIRDFVLVDEVAASVAAAAHGGGPIEQQVGTGVGTSLHQAALIIAEELGAPGSLVTARPMPIDDPNPITVSPDVGGTLHLCRTGFRDGIRRTLRET